VALTFLQDPDMFWDFITLRPETMHHVALFFTDRGTPDGYRHMNGYNGHTYKLVNADGEAVYCKFHHKACQLLLPLIRDALQVLQPASC